MKYLKCQICGRKISFGSKRGLSFHKVYFCSRKCFDIYSKVELFPISDFDFEIDGEEETEE